ncbi:PLP-dependent aminotransferase family protein [Streptomyces violaceusniger]|uniref:aminotransferase-like domain-containing protein n=1 Tax=Streptomyces violaceusniger TaxID=68280 RepID=UPI00342FF142
MTTAPGSPRPGLLDPADLHDSLTDPVLRAMTFLNEVADRFPDAISFAPGRPTEEVFDLEDVHRWLRGFWAHLRDERGYDEAAVRRTAFQYGGTKGIVSDLVARHLLVDEGIEVGPGSLVVTVGAQEALLLVLRALRAREQDVLLAVEPSYVGLTGAARLLDMPVHPVREGAEGVDLTHLVARIRELRATGRRPRALYVVPDFCNPTGVTMSVDDRHRLLRIAAEEGVLLLEDNPYGIFRAFGERLPTLKALDTGQWVVYVGSLAKTGFPGARVGFVVADQRVTDAGSGQGLFADELSKIKSMVTVNTSAVSQAAIGGMLLEHEGSLVRANTRQVAIYRRNLTRLRKALQERLGGIPGVSWNAPDGGFFLLLTVPFPVDDTLLEESAARHGVLWTPLSHFYPDAAPRRQMRLSFSALTTAQIDEGVDRLHALIQERMAEGGARG